MNAIQDIEPVVFTRAYNAVKAQYPDIDMASLPTFKDAKVLAARLYEADSYTDKKTLSLSNTKEQFANLLYEVQIRSNSRNGKKAQANAVYAIINEELINMGFARISKAPFFEDTAFRIVARYSGKVDREGQISRR